MASTFSSEAMEIAAEMDRLYRTDPTAAGPPHCSPIVPKDNYNTVDLPRPAAMSA